MAPDVLVGIYVFDTNQDGIKRKGKFLRRSRKRKQISALQGRGAASVLMHKPLPEPNLEPLTKKMSDG